MQKLEKSRRAGFQHPTRPTRESSARAARRTSSAAISGESNPLSRCSIASSIASPSAAREAHGAARDRTHRHSGCARQPDLTDLLDQSIHPCPGQARNAFLRTPNCRTFAFSTRCLSSEQFGGAPDPTRMIRKSAACCPRLWRARHRSTPPDRRAPQPGGIEQGHRQARNVHAHLDHVPGRPRNLDVIAASRPASAIQSVDLPMLGAPTMATSNPSRTRSAAPEPASSPIPSPRPLAGFRPHQAHRPGSLHREVDCRLQRCGADEIRPPAFRLGSQPTAQNTKRLLPLRLGLGIDEIRQTLDRTQVQSLIFQGHDG